MSIFLTGLRNSSCSRLSPWPPSQVHAFLNVLRATFPWHCFLLLHWALSGSAPSASHPPTQMPSGLSQVWLPHWAPSALLLGANIYLDLPYLMALGLTSSVSEENKKAESLFRTCEKMMLKYLLKINVQPNKCMKCSPTRLSLSQKKEHLPHPKHIVSFQVSHPPKDS